MSKLNPLCCDTPARVLEALKDIPGNEQVKRAVACSLTVAEHNFSTKTTGNKRDIVSFTPLFIGPARSGKTCVVRALTDSQDMELHHITLTEVTPVGWHGKSLNEHLQPLLRDHSNELLFLELSDLDTVSIAGDKEGYYRRVQLSLIKLLKREIRGTESWCIFLTGRFNENEERVTDRTSLEATLKAMGIIPQVIEAVSPVVFLKSITDTNILAGLASDPLIKQLESMNKALGKEFGFSLIEQEIIVNEYQQKGRVAGHQLFTNICMQKMVALPSLGVLFGTQEEVAEAVADEAKAETEPKRAE